MRRLAAALTLVIAFSALALPAAAHPLGNFTTNVHLGVIIEGDRLGLVLVVDMAEIPTFRENLDVDGDGEISESDLASYSQTLCQAQSANVVLEDPNSFIPLVLETATAELREGDGGLNTLRIECHLEASTAAHTFTVSNGVFSDRIGWVEMVVVGGAAPGIPSVSPSAVLEDYPSTTPPAQRQATITVGDTTPADEQSTVTVAPITQRLAEGLTRSGSTGGLVALLAAAALGMTHALAPGHGKTLMAAYLVGRNGKPRQAMGLGMAVAVSHTLGVAVLGLITAGASSVFKPEGLYPWLTTGSALIVTGLGLALLVRALRRQGNGHHHGHDHGDDHGHGHGHDHDHDHGHNRLPDLGWRSLAALGLAGGLVPSASAVVLLLGALAIGRPWFGVTLVFFFGIGMAVALVGAGLVALRISRAGLNRIERRFAVSGRLVPALGGLAVTVVGAFLLWDGARTLL